MSLPGFRLLALLGAVLFVFVLGSGAQSAVSANSITIDSATLVPHEPGGPHSGDVVITGTYVCTNGQSHLMGRALQGPAEASNFGTFGAACTGSTQNYSLLLANTSRVRVHPGPADIELTISDTDNSATINEAVFLKH